jgi:hypothetical protein
MSEEKFQEHAQAVQAHLTILQSVIQRMAANSASAKASCITLVSAILVIVADKGKPQYAWLALFPAVLFLVLDSYYLRLERDFRVSYNQFVKKLHEKTLVQEDMFVVAPAPAAWWKRLLALLDAMRSFSVWPFYATLGVLVFLAWKLVIKA